MEADLLKIITKRQAPEIEFAALVNSFDKKLMEFNPVQKSFEIKKYFLNGGIKSVTKKLLNDKIVSETSLYEYTTKSGKIKKDFKGLYVFFHDKTPIYVGISKGVIGRILQHVKGHSHNTSTLAYTIGILRHQLLTGEKYIGARKEFDFKANVTPVKEFLLKQRIAFLPVQNTEELYLFEIYCAMQLQCFLNKFETH